MLEGKLLKMQVLILKKREKRDTRTKTVFIARQQFLLVCYDNIQNQTQKK